VDPVPLLDPHGKATSGDRAGESSGPASGSFWDVGRTVGDRVVVEEPRHKTIGPLGIGPGRKSGDVVPRPCLLSKDALPR